MPKNKKPTPQDQELKAFIKSGGRKDAETDFNTILKRAVKPKASNKTTDSKKPKRS